MKIIVSFSGGKDSQACLIEACKEFGARQVITTPCSLSNAVAILKREKAKSPKKRDWIKLKINIYPTNPEIIQFKNE